MVGNPLITGRDIRQDKAHLNGTFAVFQPLYMILFDLCIQIVNHLLQRLDCLGKPDILCLKHLAGTGDNVP